jgi:PhnB protein
MRYCDSPDPAPEGCVPPGFEKKIMHAEIRVRGIPLFVSDGNQPGKKMDGVHLALTLPTEADAHAFFNALAAGGSVTMPLMKTFWSPCFGMLTDPFGLDWMVMVPGEGPPK